MVTGTKCLFCKNRGPIPGIHYFRLTSARHDLWLRAIGKNPNAGNLTNGNHVCSLHFDKEDIIITHDRIRLKPGAIPTKILGIPDSLTPLEDMSTLMSTDTTHSSQQELSVSEVQAPVASIYMPTASDAGHNLHDNENIEEGLSFNYLEVPMDEKESLSSLISTLDPLSVPSTGEEIDSRSIISIIYVLVGILIFCSIKSNRDILPVRQIKRELELSGSDGEDENTIKRAKEDVKTIHSYSKNPNDLEERLEAMTVKKDLYREKLKTATKRVNRLTQKVQSFKKILSNLKKKNLLDEEAISLLNEAD